MSTTNDVLTSDDGLLALLPRRVRELIELIGLTATMTLVDLHGGTHIYVPNRAKPTHWLAEQIGMEALEKLSERHGDSNVDIPRCAALLKALQHQTIAAEFNSGMTTRQLARKYHTSERNIRRIRRQVMEIPMPLNLDMFCVFGE